MRFSIIFRLCFAQVLLLLAVPSAHSQMWPGSPAPHVPPMALAWFGAAGVSYLGVGAVEIDTERARSLKLREDRGVKLTCIEDGSPAAEAGLQVGDVVLRYGGKKIDGMEQLSRLVRE
ncbi:MAG: PDZ domain-containing protein, partial [Bryobacteraceae bacterium]